MSESPVLLSWIVPLYCNGGFAAELIARAHAAAGLAGLPCEIILVNDCCPEQSGRQAAEAAGRQPAARVRILDLPVNLGQDSAVREGLRVCRGSYALIIDGDLQDPPEILAQLWAAMRQHGAEVIFAARHGGYESAGRLTTSRIYRKLMEWVGGLPPRAGVCALLGPRAISSIAGTRVKTISILAALGGARLHCRSVSVQRQARRDRRSAYTSWARSRKAVHSLLQLVQARWLRVPL